MRTDQVLIRVSAEEKSLLREGAGSAGMTLSEFIRFQTLGVKPGENDSRRRAREGDSENRDGTYEGGAKRLTVSARAKL